VSSKPAKFEDSINQALYINHSRVSLPRLLHRSDAVSMAHGLEARLPFLDHRLVEFCFALPGQHKIAGMETKRILRQAVADLLPPAIVNRSNKRGFDTPFGQWLRGPLGEAVAAVFADPRARARGILNVPAVQLALASHRAGRPILDQAGTHLWRWLTVELWFREFID
jgi:asparagine synthase (glutamine-hydrolysing)